MDFRKLSDEVIWSYYDRKASATWPELADIIAHDQGVTISAESLRKRMTALKKSHEADFTPDGEQFRDLEIKKQIFRDERNGWSKQNRDQARTEANIQMLEKKLEEVSILFGTTPAPRIAGQQRRTMIIICSDWHIGLDFQSIYGDYSVQIAHKRLQTYIDRITALQQLFHCEEAVIMTVGDLIHGAIHRTCQIQSRETVVDQVKDATEALTNLIFSLLLIFPHIRLTGSTGNHSRLTEDKSSSLRDERLDDLINWMTAKLLQNEPRFEYIKPIDSTIADIMIYEHEVLGVHGDFDRASKNGIMGLVTSLHRFPELICTGHMHSPAFMEAQGVQLVQGGSLCGSGDDYTTTKRLSGKPSQTAIIISEAGLESIHPIQL